MAWWDFYKLFTYAFEEDPITKAKHSQNLSGAGVIQPDAIPDIRQDGSFWGGSKGQVRLRDTNDFIDLSSVTNRQSRYKEYERLRNVAEIETAMTVFADETCIGPGVKIATLYDGFRPIRWLAQNKADEEFLVYCWDFEKNDYTLGWAYNPRFVKVAKTVKILLDDGTHIICTHDHRILLRTGEWIFAGDLKKDDELMPFFNLEPNKKFNKLKEKQFPRVYSHRDGWKHERQFIDEWKTGKVDEEYDKKIYEPLKLVAEGVHVTETARLTNTNWLTIQDRMHREGFTLKELRHLGQIPKRKKVLKVLQHENLEVFDLSVHEHENFCGESAIFHNCQKGDNNHLCKIECSNEEVVKELEYVMFNRKMWNIDRKLWSEAKNLFIHGDRFWEPIINPENPKDGILKFESLPPDSMYRIETTKGKLVEFQQSNEGPDYQSLTRSPVTQATEQEIKQSTAIRFAPNQIVHIKIGDDRKQFYPYGVSLVEAARGPAHQLRLMEDAMVVYRLSRAPERRVFYIDVAQLPPFKAEAFMERMKDQFRKKKVSGGKGTGVNSVEERWHAPAVDEDFWIPVRPNANTRVETLPGAQNLGEIDDAVYFRNKLFVSLNFPRNYFSNEDAQATRISLSAQDVKFARQIERLQGSIEDGLYNMSEKHLQLRGFPEESYKDLKINMTPPSDWREMSRAEVITARISNAGSIKGSQLMSDYDILTKWMKYGEEESKEIVARSKLQKLEDMKLQILAQNPQLLGVGVPGAEGEEEIGTETGGPNPMLGGEEPMGAAGGEQPVMAAKDELQDTNNAVEIPDADEEDIKKFDMEIQNYAAYQDREEIDYSQLG